MCSEWHIKMGTAISSFFRWMFNGRTAQNTETVTRNDELTPLISRQRHQTTLVSHNESLASLLKGCREMSRDLKSSENVETTGKVVPLEESSKARKKDGVYQVVAASVEDQPVVTDKTISLEDISKTFKKDDNQVVAAVNDQTVPPPPVSPRLPPPPPPPLPPPVGSPLPPPPPPPPGGSPSARILPHGLTEKEKIKVPKKLPNPRWKNVDVNSLSQDAIWVKQGDQAMSIHKEYLVKNLTSKFPQLGRSISFHEPNRTQMDNQLCLKLTILKNTVKTSNPNEIVDHILQCNKKFLTSEILKQLRNLLPKEGANNFLDEPSKSFLSPILNISRLPERIEVLLFRLEHEESINEHQRQFFKNIKTVQKACRELKRSESVTKILNLILYIGNVMKSSSNEPLSYGFDISYLVKLNGMKQENKQFSLLDFLVETICKKFPECLNFQTEIPSIPDASCVSFMEITEWLNQQRSGLQKVETEIKEANCPSNGDKLKDVLIPFAEIVVKNTAKLEGAMLQMMTEFQEINIYFAYAHENKEIDQCIEFFGYFKTFQEQFLFSANKMKQAGEKRNKK